MGLWLTVHCNGLWLTGHCNGVAAGEPSWCDSPESYPSHLSYFVINHDPIVDLERTVHKDSNTSKSVFQRGLQSESDHYTTSSETSEDPFSGVGVNSAHCSAVGLG